MSPNPMPRLQQAASEGFRRHFELGLHFAEDLVLAKDPDEALKLHFDFFTAQIKLLGEQAAEMQGCFAEMFRAAIAKNGAGGGKSV